MVADPLRRLNRFLFPRVLLIAIALSLCASLSARAENNPPVANDTFIYGLPGETVSIDLSASDPDDDELVFSAIDSPSETYGVLNTSKWTFIPNSAFDYAANGGILETSFRFSVSDTGSLSDSAVCTIILRPGGNAPVVTDVTLYVGQYPSSVEFVLTSIDAETSDLSIVCPSPSFVQPQFGSVIRTGGRVDRYKYSVSETIVGLSLTETFGYTAFDGVLLSTTGVITIIITQPPQPVALSFSVVAFGSVAMSVSTVDPDDTELTYAFRNGPLRGSISGSAPNFIYTPDPGFAGYDDFEYVVSDEFYSIAAPIRVQVLPAGDPGRTDDLRCSISHRQTVYHYGVAVLACCLIIAGLRARAR
ncbi:MAG: Ig-like domain-containing protein [Planctomycetota bacterium]